MIDNKVILLTGGTGSFGTSFAKKILKDFKPKKLIIFSRDELKQFNLQNELSKFSCVRYFLGDIRDKNRLMMAFNGVDIVIHAAALKQVPTAEYNPFEFIQTNVLGAQNIIEACHFNGVKKVIALSTDKAVNPINLYGSTKLSSDKLFISANNMGLKTKFSVVRYGNVINSRGSVIPLFKNLINKKSKIFPITDKRMTRFFLSIEDGCQFVIDCLKMMRGGEIFIPKIYSSKIIDILLAMKEGAKIKVIGIRKGEKLHEVMCPKDESHITYDCDNFYMIYDKNVKNLFYNYRNKKVKPKKVQKDFEYSSLTNSLYCNIHNIHKITSMIDD